MSSTYIDQLIAIREDLKSPIQHLAQDAYDLLYQLWLENNVDPDFTWKFEQVFEEFQILIQEFQLRFQKELFLNYEDKTNVRDGNVLISTELSIDPLLFNQNEKEDKIKDMKSHVPKIFISYSHKDEAFKDELVTMLAGLQRRKVIDAWQDRRIEPGDEWFNVIKRAMNECDMAVILVSPDFIASEFIQKEEITHLFKRRIEDGLRVVPIIVRPCLWQSEPVLKNLQALPKDAMPVISFSKETGARDQVWTDISIEIESFARQLTQES